MASYTQGKPLPDLKVETAMAKDPISCGSEDDLDGAAELMREKCLCGLPVVDSHGVLVGLLSLDDIACESQRNLRGAEDHTLAVLTAMR